MSVDYGAMVGRVRHALDHPPATLYVTDEEIADMRANMADRAGYRFEDSLGINGGDPAALFGGIRVIVDATRAADQAAAAARG